MQIKMTQHPVGQGGLFSGELHTGHLPLRWVYDCGSNQRDALQREIKTVSAGGEIDLLFLSHLDSDHINGVDQLLAQVKNKVRQVVLPYLNETMLLATIARDASRGSLNGNFVEAASNLAAWFGSRGVETITFVDGTDDDEDDGPDGPFLPFEPSGDEGECRAEWSQEPKRIRALSGHIAMMQRVAPDAALKVMTSRNVLNWAFIPYVHAPSTKRLRAFKQELKVAFGSPLNMKDIVFRAKDIGVRDKLRDCYDALWRNHNLITMTLYSGPIKSDLWEVVSLSSRHLHSLHWFEPPRWHGGWMLTGDADLDGLRRRERFLKFYRRLTPLINVFMLPHHGSIHNHSDLVLDAMPNLIVGYAASGSNSYGHPHRDVKGAVNLRRGAHFHRVSEKPSSKIVIEQKNR